MIFTVHKDGKIYPAREMLDAFEFAQRNNPIFSYLLSLNVSNTLQV